MEMTVTHVHVLLLDFTGSIFDDDEGSTNTSSIRSDMNRLLLQVDVDTDELVDPTRATKVTESTNESRSTSSESKDVTIEVNDQVTFGIDLSSIEYVDVCEGTLGRSQLTV